MKTEGRKDSHQHIHESVAVRARGNRRERRKEKRSTSRFRGSYDTSRDGATRLRGKDTLKEGKKGKKISVYHVSEVVTTLEETERLGSARHMSPGGKTLERREARRRNASNTFRP